MNNSNQTRENLIKICSDIFSLAIKIRTSSSNLGVPSQLLARVKEMFATFDARARNMEGLEDNDAHLVKYGLVALLDEMILSSDWTGKAEWQAQSLQLEYFHENVAGVEFFTKLDELRLQIGQKIHLLEVYYYCLILGFEGKYKVEGLEPLRALKNNIGEDLKRSGKDVLPELSPKWEPPPEYMKKMQREVPHWVLSVGLVSIAFIFYIAFSIMISSESSEITLVLEGLLARVLE